jgi:hypothetical protein
MRHPSAVEPCKDEMVLLAWDLSTVREAVKRVSHYYSTGKSAMNPPRMTTTQTLTARPQIINCSSAHFPAPKVVLHNLFKVRPDALEWRTVIPIIKPRLLTLAIGLSASSTNDASVRPWDQVISDSWPVAESIGMREVRRWIW